MTARRRNSSVQAQRCTDLSILQHLPEPADLVRGPEERMGTVDGGEPSVEDVLDLADRLGGDIPDPLDVLLLDPQAPGRSGFGIPLGSHVLPGEQFTFYWRRVADLGAGE